MRTWLSNVNPRFQQNPTRYWIFNMQGIENGGPLLLKLDTRSPDRASLSQSAARLGQRQDLLGR